jgi:hypothetical protein
MMFRSKKSKSRGMRANRGELMKGRARVGYEQVVKVSGNVAISPSTAGSTFYGVRGFTVGSGTSISPNSAGTNYATLSQWGDFRLAKIKLTFLCQVGSAGDPLQIVTALDSTGQDLVGSGAATGAFNTILSRQSAKITVVSPSQFRPQSVSYRPAEAQNRLWRPQSDLSGPVTQNFVTGEWGILVSAVCPAASVTISMLIEWFFDVREPTLSGVLLGRETDDVRERLQKLARTAFPASVKSDEPTDTLTTLRKEIADARLKLQAAQLKQ